MLPFVEYPQEIPYSQAEAKTSGNGFQDHFGVFWPQLDYAEYPMDIVHCLREYYVCSGAGKLPTKSLMDVLEILLLDLLLLSYFT